MFHVKRMLLVESVCVSLAKQTQCNLIRWFELYVRTWYPARLAYRLVLSIPKCELKSG